MAYAKSDVTHLPWDAICGGLRREVDNLLIGMVSIQCVPCHGDLVCIEKCDKVQGN